MDFVYRAVIQKTEIFTRSDIYVFSLISGLAIQCPKVCSNIFIGLGLHLNF